MLAPNTSPANEQPEGEKLLPVTQRERHQLKCSLPLPRFISIPAPGHPTDMKTVQVLTLPTTSPVRVYFGHGSSLTSACYLTRLDQYPPRKAENESAPFEGLVALVLAHSYPLCRGKKMRERKGEGKERKETWVTNEPILWNIACSNRWKQLAKFPLRDQSFQPDRYYSHKKLSWRLRLTSRLWICVFSEKCLCSVSKATGLHLPVPL